MFGGGKDHKSSSQEREGGSVGIKFQRAGGGANLPKSLPVGVVCKKAKQHVIAQGVEPLCKVRFFKFG